MSLSPQTLDLIPGRQYCTPTALFQILPNKLLNIQLFQVFIFFAFHSSKKSLPLSFVQFRKNCDECLNRLYPTF